MSYSPLADPERNIRLLVINPARWGDFLTDRLDTSLKEVCLDDYQSRSRRMPPSFVAISYCWGDAADREAILCNNRDISITRSLYEALLCLRRVGEATLVWADAVCINQDDDDEKAAQVRMMRRIYETAESVAVWLGDDSDDSHDVMYLTEQFGKARNRVPVLLDSPEDYADAAVWRALLQRLPPLSFGGWRAVGQFLQRPWFGRVWVIQEVAVARRVVLHCDRFSAPWDDLAELVSFMLAAGLLESSPDDHVAQASALITTRRRFQRGQLTADDFLQTMLRHRPCQATLARDKIFALSGLVQFPLRPDYRRSDEAVFVEAAQAIMTATASLDILMVPRASSASSASSAPSASSASPAARRRLILPSWVPDWTDVPFVAPLARHSLHGEPADVRFSAGGNAASTLDPNQAPPWMVDGGRVLSAQGIVFDVVQEASKVIDNMPRAGGSIGAIIYRDCRFYSTLATWEQVGRLRSAAPYVTGEDMADVYWRTLLAGRASRDEDIESSRLLYERFRQTWRRWLFVFQLPLIPTSLLVWACWAVAMLGVLFMQAKRRLFGWQPLGEDGDAGDEELQRFKTAVLNRRMVRTQGGYLGLVASGTRKGDAVVLLRGCSVPVVLRRGVEGGEWGFVGDGYIHGIMHGEAFIALQCQTVRIK